MEERTITVYKFEELDDTPKEAARSKIIEWFDWEWWDCIEDDAKNDLAEVGFEKAKIAFSGFYSQGDGLSFTADCDIAKLFDHIDLPAPAARHRNIFEELFYVTLTRTSSHYSHERTVRLEVEYNEYGASAHRVPRIEALRKELEIKLDNLRVDLCHRFYTDLEKEWEYMCSDEYITEHCDANDYRFDAHGRIV